MNSKGKGSTSVGQHNGSNDGDPGLEDCEDNFSNPNSEKPFHEIPGPRGLASGLCSAFEYLKLFFTVEIFQVIVTQTNLYLQQCQITKPSLLPWKDVSTEEVMAFIAVVIAMGTSNLPEIYDY